jgi:hypothetical protein
LTANPERKEGIDLKPITNALPRTSEYDPLNPENTDNAQ